MTLHPLTLNTISLVKDIAKYKRIGTYIHKREGIFVTFVLLWYKMLCLSNLRKKRFVYPAAVQGAVHHCGEGTKAGNWHTWSHDVVKKQMEAEANCRHAVPFPVSMFAVHAENQRVLPTFRYVFWQQSIWSA